jgi:DsbC/DsbD-like thiol-disulfide interchange protein
MLRALAIALALATLARPAASAPAEARLLDGWRDGPGHVAALEIVLPDGWHTYWRVPGSTGIPPRFDWSGSTNLAAVRVEWPHPDVFESFGTRTIGYHNRVILPLVLTPRDPTRPVELALALSYGVCKDICIPASAVLAGRFGDGPSDRASRTAIEAALARRARRAAEGGVLDATCALSPNGAGHALAATVRLRAAPRGEQVAVIEAAARPDLWIGEAQSRTEGATITAEAPVEASGGAGPMIDRARLVLTLIDRERTVEITGCRAPG